jgi:hypothetical protein
MAVDYGGMVTGDYTHAGVVDEQWQGWSEFTQDKWLQDYMRTQEQEDYHETSGGWDTVAYVYTGYIDLLLGTDAAEVGETTNEYVEVGKEYIPKALGLAGEGVLLLGIGALALLLGKK